MHEIRFDTQLRNTVAEELRAEYEQGTLILDTGRGVAYTEGLPSEQEEAEMRARRRLALGAKFAVEMEKAQQQREAEAAKELGLSPSQLRLQKTFFDALLQQGLPREEAQRLASELVKEELPQAPRPEQVSATPVMPSEETGEEQKLVEEEELLPSSPSTTPGSPELEEREDLSEESEEH